MAAFSWFTAGVGVPLKSPFLKKLVRRILSVATVSHKSHHINCSYNFLGVKQFESKEKSLYLSKYSSSRYCTISSLSNRLTLVFGSSRYGTWNSKGVLR